MNKRRISLIAVGLLLISVVGFAGCRGKSSDSGQTPLVSGDEPAFNVNGAKQLVALSNTVAPSSTSGAPGFFSKMFGNNTLFQYRVVNQGLSNQQVRDRVKGLSTDLRSAATTTQLTGTNLLAIDEEGNAELAVNANYLIKVMYSVTDPAGEYVYLAFDTGFINPDGNDYTQFIAQSNCAFYRVQIADNSFACVMEGVYVQPMDDAYLQRVSGNQKPIQFDEDGNVYFPGTSFTRRCEDGLCTMAAADWNPKIYRQLRADWSVLPLTQDNQKVSYFLVLTTGELAYQSINTQTGDISLYLWQESSSTMNKYGTTTNLTGNTVGVDFFNVDSYNTIMWGGWLNNGIRFARPSASGVEKAILDTKLFKPKKADPCFGGQATPETTYPPRRMIVGDDGKLYGVFQEEVTDYGTDPDTNGQAYCSDPTKWKFYTKLKVTQVLPYSAVPKLELSFQKIYQNQSFSWQQWMGSTPFQVSNGYLFYKETKEKLGYGTFNTIKMVSLKDRSTITLLGGDNDWYEIYNWRLKGDRLYFAALDLSKTIVVSGEIDTAAVKQNPYRPPSDYLTVRQTASAIGATSRVQDIEALVAVLPTADASAPLVNQFNVSPENIYSASIEFSKRMNNASVEDALTLTDEDTGKSIVSMKAWIQKNLYLIPDLDDNGTNQADDPLLDLTSTTPLKINTNYQIALGAGILDADGEALTDNSGANPLSLAFKTMPSYGWYASNGIAKYAGSEAVSNYGWTYYPEWWWDLFVGSTPTTPADNVPTDFRLQFKAKNYQTNGARILLWDNGAVQPNTLPLTAVYSGITYTYYGVDNSGRQILDLTLSSNPYLNYAYPNSSGYGYPYEVDSTYASGDYAPLMFNGDWMTYRIDVYGSHLRISYSPDGITFTNATWQVYDRTLNTYESKDSFTDIVPRDPARAYKLYLGVTQPVDIDDIKIFSLDDSSGAVTATTMEVSFTDDVLPAGTTSSADIPNLVTRVTTTLPTTNNNWPF